MWAAEVPEKNLVAACDLTPAAHCQHINSLLDKILMDSDLQHQEDFLQQPCSLAARSFVQFNACRNFSIESIAGAYISFFKLLILSVDTSSSYLASIEKSFGNIAMTTLFGRNAFKPIKVNVNPERLCHCRSQSQLYWLAESLDCHTTGSREARKVCCAALLSTHTTNIRQQGDESVQRGQNPDFGHVAAASFHSCPLWCFNKMECMS